MQRVIQRMGHKASAILLIVATFLAAAASPAAARPSEVSAASSLSPDLFRTDERGALARLAMAKASQPQALAPIVYADIACHILPTRYVQDKGWGVDAQANRQLHIYRDLFINGQWWKTTENWPYASSSGSWSTPTGDHASLLSGTFMLWVTAYYNSDNAYIGRATDTCTA